MKVILKRIGLVLGSLIGLLVVAFIGLMLIGGVRASMGYLGCRTIDEMRTRPKFMKISAAGLRESHVHDVIITKEAPNYKMES